MATEEKALAASVAVPAPGNTGSVMGDAELYLPPWRERRQDGSLGEVYGPNSTTAYARQVQKHRDWSWRTPSKEAQREDADVLRAYMRSDKSATVPTSERKVYELVYELGHSVRYVARKLGVRRETVKSYIKRLKERLNPDADV